jgi:hypothetical protein
VGDLRITFREAEMRRRSVDASPSPLVNAVRCDCCQVFATQTR